MSASHAPFGDLTLTAFSEALASDAPTPGGGSACAVAGVLAASLTAMVARLSADRPKYAAYAATHSRVLGAAEAARARFLDLADQDAAAYAAFGEARRLPRDTPEEAAQRDAAISAAGVAAAEVPLEVVRQCHALVHEVESLSGRSNLNASSDLEVAAQLSLAAARGAAANVLTNIPSIDDRHVTGTMLSEVEARLHEIESAVARIHGQVRSGNLRGPETA
jgi:formiminotetrahydrofolate cyclodeaminase